MSPAIARCTSSPPSSMRQRCRDGHVQALALGKRVDGARRAHTLGHHAKLSENLGQRLALRQPEAHPIVARMDGRAGDDEIPHPGKADLLAVNSTDVDASVVEVIEQLEPTIDLSIAK